MPNLSVVGNGPVTLTTSDGQQISIPLSDLYFDSTNIIRTDRWPLHTKYKSSDVDPWLNYLVKNGELTPGQAPAPTPAIVITAAVPGQAGNNIQVTFSNVTDTSFDAQVVETNTYATLSSEETSPNFIKTVLGTDAVAGSQPGLVCLRDTAAAILQPKMQSLLPLAGGDATTRARVKIEDASGGEAFTLEAKKNGADGSKTTVSIPNVDTTANTFTLVATWTSQITGIDVAHLPDALTGGGASGYEIAVSAPAGGVYQIPAPGTVTLVGGANQQGAVAAATIVFAN